MNIRFSRGLLVKLLIIVVAALVVYSVFWFFKLGQVEKQINRLISENSSNVSISDISVSGFPLSQKITISDLRFSPPTPALNKNQILIKSLEATAGIFQSKYSIKITGKSFVYDQEGSTSNLEFNSAPKISISILDGIIGELSYQDSGYKIIDSNKNTVYSSLASSLSVKSSIDENDRVIFNIIASISGINGFEVADIYHNVFEGRIVKALKTGELAIGDPINPIEDPELVTEEATSEIENLEPVDAAVEVVNPVVAIDSKKPTVAPVVAPVKPLAKKIPTVATQKVPAPVALASPAPVPADPAPSSPVVVVVPTAPTPTIPGTPVIADSQQPSINSEVDLAKVSAAEVAAAQVAPPAVPAKEIISTSDFSLNVDYILTPNKTEQKTPMDIVQISEVPLQYSKSIKINSLKFINKKREININGEVNIFSDDSLPSGGISIQLSNFSSTLKAISARLNKMAHKSMVKPIGLDNVVIESDIPTIDVSTDNLYGKLLQRFSFSLNDIAREVAVKNAVSSDEIAQFDIRREKNLEFLVNETPAREILGKF